MNYKHFVSIVISTILISCGSGDKKSQLEKLIKQRDELNGKIVTLQKEVNPGKNDSLVKKKMVGVINIKPQPFQHMVEIQGRVDADENISLSAKVPGTITDIFVKEGDEVRIGKSLAEIDNQQIISGIEEIKTQLAFASNVYEKQKNLWDKKIGTELQYLSAKNNKEALEKKLHTMNEQLEMTRIKSPINGTVDEVSIKIGQAVAPGMPAFRVVNFSSLKVKADVAESYISKISEGNKVIVYFPDLQKEISSKISFAGRVINPQNRTFTVEAVLEKNNPQYHPNMIAILKVNDYESVSALVVPLNLVTETENGQHVFVAVNESGKWIARKKTVTVGRTYGGNAEITSGLKEGDTIITSGYQGLNEGDILEIGK